MNWIRNADEALGAKIDAAVGPYWRTINLLAIGLCGLLVVLVAMAVLNPARAEGIDKARAGATLVPVGELAKVAPGSWSGVYLSAGVGYQIADTNLDLNANAPTYQFAGSLLEIDGLSGRGWTYDGRIGVDFHVPNTVFVVGILGGYKGGETEFSVNTDLGNFGNALNATMRQTWYAGGRVGIASGKSLYYVGYAWTQGEMDISIPLAPTACSSVKGLNCSQDIDGRMLLAGMETQIAPQWTLGMEYTLTQYDTASILSLAGGQDSLRLDADTDVHAFMARLSFRPLAK